MDYLRSNVEKTIMQLKKIYTDVCDFTIHFFCYFAESVNLIFYKIYLKTFQNLRYVKKMLKYENVDKINTSGIIYQVSSKNAMEMRIKNKDLLNLTKLLGINNKINRMFISNLALME